MEAVSCSTAEYALLAAAVVPCCWLIAIVSNLQLDTLRVGSPWQIKQHHQLEHLAQTNLLSFQSDGD